MSDERRARAALSRLAEPRDLAVHQMLAQVGAAETVARLCAGHGSLARFAARVRTLDTDRDLQIAARVGARLVVPGDEEWPVGLDDLAIPPWCLWVRGPLSLGEGVRAGPWCPGPLSESTPPLTVGRWPSTARPWRCSLVVSTGSTRPPTARC